MTCVQGYREGRGRLDIAADKIIREHEHKYVIRE